MIESLEFYMLVIFAAAAIGGAVSLFRRWNDNLLHLFVSFSAGILLGTVFLHLLPESLSGGDADLVAPLVLVGYLGMFFVERFLILRGQDTYDYGHRIVSLTALFGLSLHALIEGFGLALGAVDAEIGRLMFISIVIHKPTAAFAITSLLLLARISVGRSMLLLLGFAAMTPLGAFLAAPAFSGGGHELVSALTGFTAGTFLYITTGDLLPEVFHTKESRWLKLLLLVIGVAIVAVVGEMAGAH